MVKCGRCIRTARFATISRASRAGAISMTRITRYATAVMAVALFLAVAARPAAATLTVTIWQSGYTFSPNGDGSDDTLTVWYYLTEAANVDVTVYPLSGPAVRVLQTNVSQSGGWQNVTWDGLNGNGQDASDGEYTVVVDAQNGTGSDTGTMDTVIDRRAPGSLVTPTPGAVLSGNASFDFQPTPGFDTFNDIQSVGVTCIGDGALQVNGHWTGSGDTASCAGGPTSLNATVDFIDQFGASHTWTSKPVNVTITNPVRVDIPYWITSRTFSPNGDGQEDTLPVSYCLSEDATVTIKVYPPGNPTAGRTSATPAGGGDGAYYPPGACGSWWYYSQRGFEWDGKNDANQVVADGDYTIKIDAQTASDDAVATFETAVDTRLPGELTTPTNAAALSGNNNPFVFTPTPSFDNLAS